MAVSTTHPQYGLKLNDWLQMQHTYEGEQEVKRQRTLYLPATSGMIADGMASSSELGYKAYSSYLTRAVFPDMVKQAVDAMVGLMHKKPPLIKLPDKLKPLLKSCTLQGESLPMLLRRINEGQLIYGRYGLLVEVPDGSGPNVLPYLAPYDAQSMTNWDDYGKFVILREKKNEPAADFSWKEEIKYRVCVFRDNIYMVQTVGGDGVNETVFDDKLALKPAIAGNEFKQLPFVFINTNDLVPDVDDIPLLGVSNLSLTIYRLQADYRQTLFQQGQETLVIIGASQEAGKERRIGANAVIELPKDCDAKYVGVSAQALGEMREALKEDMQRAAEMGAKIIDTTSTQQSGEALRIRMASKTATLTSIAKTAAEGLQQALRYCAEIVGANPEEVVVEADTDFAEQPVTGQELLLFTNAKLAGAPISWESIHRILKQRDLTEYSYEEEKALIDAEI
jgi:hypothetical protein